MIAAGQRWPLARMRFVVLNVCGVTALPQHPSQELPQNPAAAPTDARAVDPVQTEQVAPPKASSPKSAGESASEATHLLLITHGEAMQARYADFRGANSGLTARGWQQADGLAEWLRARDLAGIACTAQLPARLTAQHVAQRVGLSLSGQPTLAAAPASSSQGSAGLAANGVQGDGARSTKIGSVDERFTDALHSLLAQHRGQAFALISDANTVMATVRQLFKAPQLRLELDAASAVELVQRGEVWSLAAVNQQWAQQVTVNAPTATAEQPEPFHDEHLALIAATYNRVAQSVTAEGERERRRRVQHLLDFAGLSPDESTGEDIVGRMIDLGTGSGLLALAASEALDVEVVGIDVSAGMLERAEFLRLSDANASARRVRYQLAAAQTLPFPDEHFAVAMLRLVLHHNAQPERVVREAARVLAAGGLLLLADLLSDEDPVKRATQNTIETRRNPSHVAALSASQYRQLLVDNGFALLDEREVHFERELDDWLDDLEVDAARRETVRDMVMAGIETDAAGLGARLVKKKLVFDQRLFYAKAVKE